MRGCGLSVTPRLALAIFVSLAAFFAGALRPVSLPVASTAREISTHDADTPVAIEDEARSQCRVAAVRPCRDGRGNGLRGRELPVQPIGVVSARMPVRTLAEHPAPPAGACDLAPMRRVRRHLEVMVFLS